jgi:hypothetical protein
MRAVIQFANPAMVRGLQPSLEHSAPLSGRPEGSGGPIIQFRSCVVVAGYLQRKFSVFAVEFDTYPHRLRFKAKSRDPSLPFANI